MNWACEESGTGDRNNLPDVGESLPKVRSGGTQLTRGRCKFVARAMTPKELTLFPRNGSVSNARDDLSTLLLVRRYYATLLMLLSLLPLPPRVPSRDTTEPQNV